MRRVYIPILTLLSAATTTTIIIPTSCEAFVPSKTTSTTIAATCRQTATAADACSFLIQRRKRRLNFSKNIDGVDANTDVEAVDIIHELESKVSTMKVVELKAELKIHDQPTNGLKKILQERLLDFYRMNKNSSEEENSSIQANDDDDDDDDDIKEMHDEEEEKETIMEIEDDEDNDSDDYNDQDQDHDLLHRRLLNSKQKWKKKTYLLMEDVRKLVHSDDASTRQRGPRKAKEAVRRLQRWMSSSSYSSEDDYDAIYDDDGEEADDAVIVDLDSDSTIKFQNYQQFSLLRAYNLWIHALAKSGYDDAGHLAEEVLDEMQKNASNGGPTPNDVTIASVMDAHAHSAAVSSSNSGAKAAETFLFRLLEKHEADSEENDIPWSQDGDNALRNSLIVTCDTMLNAWAREGTIESAERAQLILLRLEEYQRQTGKQRRKARSKSIKKNPSSQKEATTTSISTIKRPISYATVMNAWANVGSAEAAGQAEATLESLVQRAKIDKKEKNDEEDERSTLVLVRPDTIVFNSVIQCWATSRDIRAGKKSLRLLEQMKELAGRSSRNNNSDNNDDDEEENYFDTQPDIITYNTVLSAWSHCGKKNAAPQAEKIVKELMMEQQQQKKQQIDSGNDEAINVVVANTVTFNTVLHAWSKSKLPGATDRAEKLLEFMIQSNDPAIAPDVYSFTCVMDAWAKSKEPNKALQTRKLLDQLIQMHQEALEKGDRLKADTLRPSQIPYNTVLNACAFSALKTPEEEQREAIQVAVDTFKVMSSRISSSSSRRKGNERVVSRDTVTYGLMLKSIANLMPKGTVRSRIAIQIFQECCDEGLVGFMVWNEVRRAVPSRLLQETYRLKRQCGSLEVEDLPKQWSVNCKQQRFNKQRQRQQNDRNKKTISKPKDTTFIIEPSFATGLDM